MNRDGEMRSYSAEDKRPESTGDMDSTGMSGLPPGNNLILRLSGMLAEECLYSAGEC